MLSSMAMTTPPHPDEIERIVGPQLEADLTEAGLDPPAARAIHRSLQFVVLNLLLVLASKAEVRQIVYDATDGLRREFQARFDAIDQRFTSVDQRFTSVDQRIDQLERHMRWQFYILFALLLVVLAAVLGSYFV